MTLNLNLDLFLSDEISDFIYKHYILNWEVQEVRPKVIVKQSINTSD